MSDVTLAWQARAWPAMRELAAEGVEFASDQLIERVGLPDPDHPHNSVNSAVGSMFRSASAQGLIRKTGGVRNSTQPHRHGGLVQLWIGTGR